MVAALIVLVSIPGVALADGEAEEIDITVAPSTLNLSYQGDWVTVHTDLAYTDGCDLAWFLNTVTATFIYSDSRGDLVAKFEVGAIATTIGDVTEPTTVTMTLRGENEGVVYEGSDVVRVIDVEAAKNGN